MQLHPKMTKKKKKKKKKRKQKKFVFHSLLANKTLSPSPLPLSPSPPLPLSPLLPLPPPPLIMPARFKMGGEGLHTAQVNIPSEFRVMVEDRDHPGAPFFGVEQAVEILVLQGGGGGKRLPVDVYFADGVQFYVHYVPREVFSFFFSFFFFFFFFFFLFFFLFFSFLFFSFLFFSFLFFSFLFFSFLFFSFLFFSFLFFSFLFFSFLFFSFLFFSFPPFLLIFPSFSPF